MYCVYPFFSDWFLGVIGSLHTSRARSFFEISPLHSFLDNISDVFMRNRTGPVTEMRIIITWLAPWTGKMNQILRCDWLPDLESGGILPARDYPPCPARKFLPKAINISFINQVCPVKMAGYWPRSFYCESMNLDSVSVRKHAKSELGQYPATLTSHLVPYPYI